MITRRCLCRCRCSLPPACIRNCSHFQRLLVTPRHVLHRHTSAQSAPLATVRHVVQAAYRTPGLRHSFCNLGSPRGLDSKHHWVAGERAAGQRHYGAHEVNQDLHVASPAPPLHSRNKINGKGEEPVCRVLLPASAGLAPTPSAAGSWRAHGGGRPRTTTVCFVNFGQAFAQGLWVGLSHPRP